MDSPNQCSWEVLGQPLSSVFTQADRCEIAQKHCEATGLIDFFNLYYCSLQSNTALYMPISVS